MLSVQRGHSVRYLTDEVAKAREGYYTGAVTAGEPPGVWWGAGAEKLGLSGEVDADLMEAIYTRLLDPRDPAAHDRAQWDDAAPLSAGHRKYRSAEEVYAGLLDTHRDAGPEERARLRAQAARSARQAVAFIDVTFSPPKSVTITGLAFERAAQDARARRDFEAAEAWDAHAKAVEDAMMAGARVALAYLQERAGYSRVGHHGGGSGRWIDAPNFVVAQFFQHDSRERDPQWHIHQAILNRVLCSDGVWRSIDGKAIDEHKAAAGALAERVAEAQLARSVGARVETRPDGKAREVVGVSRELIELFSGRRAQIGPKAAQLVRQFEAKVGRPPSPYERVVIHEQATLVTRKAKSHDGETRDEQFARWEEMARGRVTGGLAPLAEQLLQRAQDPGRRAEFSPRDVVERAVDAVAQTRAHYNRSDLFKAVSDALPGHLGVAPEEVLPLLDGLTDAAADLIQRLTPGEDTASLPPELRLANGESAYARHGSARFATPGQLAAEEALRAAAVERGAHRLSAEEVDEVVARFAESGVTLDVDQEAALCGVLTSGARVEVLTAAAGTGKSFLVGAIADSWTGRVFGLAPYQNAAEVLAGEGLTTKNVAAWLATQARLDRPRPSVGPNGDDEAWRLRANDLVVVDEAGTAETGDLLAIWRRCASVDAKLLLVGDPRQLSAIGPGGALSDIGRCGLTYQLAEVRRFANDWEGPASLRLRDGDPTVLAEYVKHGRLVAGGTAEQAEAMASRAWLADTLNGRESLLIVDTNAAAARVTANLRADLVRLGRVDEQGVPLGEGDDLAEWRGTVAGVGDLVEARALAWHLRRFEDNTAAPITRKTYRVLATRDDGGLTVAPILERRAPDDTSDGWNVWGERLGTPMQLPGTYVREHVSLGYACTKDSAQGRIRQEWERRAGWAAAYRELVGYTDEQDALGNAPGKGRVEHAMVFRAAHEALASVETGEEEANLTVGRLRARVQAWEREQLWAPRWVDDELAAVHNRHDQLTADATLWAAHADAPDVAAEEAAQLRADAAAARDEAEELAEQIALLEYADTARSAWFAHTAVTRDHAERARFELRARGVDIDHPTDLTTAEEWLATHRAEQAERERNVEITEDDVLDDDARETVAGARPEQLAEIGPPDIRETAVPNATEKTDAPDRRRRPTLDETSVAVRRAQETLTEIARRRAADAEREATEAADRGAAEAVRREDLLRWADTPTVDRDQAVDGDDLADDALTREG